MNEASLQDIETVADGLGEILDQVVFLGGAAVGFYATGSGAPQPRPSLDVDCIVEIHSYGDYGKFEEALRQKGFRNDQREGAPLCRWTYKNVLVDVMPTDTGVLGFSNRWYAEGIHHTRDRMLPHSQRIKILEPAYFLATKLEAVKGRGWADLRTSTDFEDVVYVIRNRTSIINEIREGERNVQQYICDMFHKLLARDDIDEAIAAVLDFGEPAGTSQIVRRLMVSISSIENDINLGS